MIRDFFAEQALGFEQVRVLTHAMVAVARVDGVHDREMMLVREFYESCTREGDPRLEDVVKGPFDPNQAEPLFGSPELAQLFVKSLILLAFADGTYAPEEDSLIRTYAGVLRVDSRGVDRLVQATKDFLLGSLAHVRNTDALRGVLNRLG